MDSVEDNSFSYLDLAVLIVRFVLLGWYTPTCEIQTFRLVHCPVHREGLHPRNCPIALVCVVHKAVKARRLKKAGLARRLQIVNSRSREVRFDGNKRGVGRNCSSPDGPSSFSRSYSQA